MSGECDSCGEHCLDCICHSEKHYEDATIHVKQMFKDFLKYMWDPKVEWNSSDELIDGFIKEFIIKEQI